MNTPSHNSTPAAKTWLQRFIPRFLVPLLWAATVWNTTPSPLVNADNGGVSHMEQTGLKTISQPSPAVREAVVTTQDKVEVALKSVPENPEQKIVDMLNQARKNFNLRHVIMWEKDQEVFFDMCHKYYLGESMIVSDNPEANLQPLRRHLYKMGTSFEELQKLFWIRSAKV